MSDCNVEIADLCCQERRSTLEAGISLIGRNTVQRGESLLETPSLLLDYTQSRQRVISLLPSAGIG